MIAINKMKLLRIRHAHVWLGLMMLIIQFCLRSERNWPTRLLLSLPHPEFWLMNDDDDWNRFDANGGCDQVSWRGKRSESDQNDRWNYVNFNHYHLAIYQSALLVFGHRSPVSWPSTHPIPTWGRFPKRIHRKGWSFAAQSSIVHPSPTLILSLAFDANLTSAWGDSKSK